MITMYRVDTVGSQDVGQRADWHQIHAAYVLEGQASHRFQDFLESQANPANEEKTNRVILQLKET